jgi:hypothetical protein
VLANCGVGVCLCGICGEWKMWILAPLTTKEGTSHRFEQWAL